MSPYDAQPRPEESVQEAAAHPKKMPLTSLDLVDLQKQKLKELFPEVFTEGNKIDFDQLKRTLGEMVDTGKERFGMQWAGRADCFKTIQQPSLATLVPCPEESIDFDTTENVFIEGDNLEVLKLLQKSYLGKIKMIYIDPPYNTGKDFIYPDNYSESLDTYLEYTGQIDGEGRKFSTNVDTDGRFHSKWMNMMYPRLFLAKNLLREDGVIFISIDDNEAKNLRTLCDEVFGVENFIGNIIWKNVTDNNPTNIATEHEYILAFAKSKNNISNVWKSRLSDAKNILIDIGNKLIAQYKNPEELQEKYSEWFREHKSQIWPLENYKFIDIEGVFSGERGVHNPGKEGYRYDIIHPLTKKPCKQPLLGYRFPKATMDKMIEEGRIIFGSDENKLVEIKVYAKDFEQKLSSVINLDGRTGTNELKDLFPECTKVFNNPKTIRLLEDIFSYVCLKDDIILDFFAGSASTAHALMELNKQDFGNRKFICVQLPEFVEEKNEAFKAGYKTIAEISKERIRRAASKIHANLELSIAQEKRELMRLNAEVAKFPDDLLFTLDRKEEYEEAQAKVTAQEELIREKELLLEKLDLGFRVFKLQKSNFNVWDSSFTTDAEQIAFQLDQHVDHISPEAEQQAILFELLLKAGFELTTPIKTLTLADKTVYSIAEGALLICLEKQLTLEVMHAIADLEPSRVIVLDEGFQNNDQLKTNASLTLKSKGILDFRTV